MRRPLLLLLFVALAATALACGGKDEPKRLSTTEYFQSLDQIYGDHQGRVDAIKPPLVGKDDAAKLAAFPDVFANEIDELGGFIDDLSLILPPKELDELNNDLLNALEDLEAALTQVEYDVDQAQSLDEVHTLLTTGDAGNAAASATAACQDAIQRATAAGVTIDLTCEQETGA